MSSNSPYVTLIGAGLGFLALVGVNMATVPGDDTAAPPPPASATTASQPAAASPSSPSTPASPATRSATASPSATAVRAFPAKVVYAGRAQAGGPAVAVAILGGEAAAYICDGRKIEAWLKGWARAGQASLTGRNGEKLTARLSEPGWIVGTASIRGKRLSFRIAAAKPPAGLYRVKRDRGANKTTIGWIILPNGSQVGIRNDGGVLSPAPGIEAGGAVVVDGQQVTPAPVQGDLDPRS